jgi:hypothetical protein
MGLSSLAHRMLPFWVGECPRGPDHRPEAPEQGAGEAEMQTDTWYDLAVRELSELTDHAKEMISEAEKAAVRTPTPDDWDVRAEPSTQAA